MINHPLAGNLWHGPSSLKRQNWESIIKSSPFNLIYTPHIYNRKIKELTDFPIGQTHLRFPGCEDKDAYDIYIECSNYIYLGNKCLNHIAMYQNIPLSYNDLPINLIEISEIYHQLDDNITVKNLISYPGFYFTSICQDVNNIIEDYIKNLNTDLKCEGYTIKTPQNHKIEFTNKDNVKEKAKLIFAWAIFKEES